MLKGALGSTRADRLFLLLFVTVALARVALLFSTQYHANGDEAAIGVMAQRILEGERPLHPSVADRHLGSALAGYSAAGAFAVLGISEPTLKVPPLLWSLAALVAVFVLVRAARGPEAAVLVSALYATSVSLLKWNFYSPGGYIVCQALFSAVLWLLLARAVVPGRARPRHDILLGFLCGFGTAILVLFAPAAVTIALFLALAGATRPPWARLSRFSAAFALGCAPLWLFDRAVDQNAPHSFLGNLASLLPSLWDALTRHLPAMLAYENIEGSPPLQLVPNGVVYVVLLAGLALLLALRGMTLGSWARRVFSSAALGGVPLEAPLLVFVAMYLVLYAVHPFTGSEARHLLPLHPALWILAGLGLYEAVIGRAERPALAVMAAVLVSIAFANGALQQARLSGDESVQGTRGPIDPNLAPAVAAFLEAEGVSHVVTDDWDLAWRMSFLTRGRIVGCHAVSEHRGWLDDEELHRTRRYAVVVRAGSHRDRSLERRVSRAGFPVARRTVRDKAVHLLGPLGGIPGLPADWCPADLRMQPVSAASAAATR